MSKIQKKAMLTALEKAFGIVTIAAKAAGIHRATHYRWLSSDKAYKKAVEDIEEMAVDVVEAELLKQIKRGEVTSTIFYLKTKGKKRGYVERRELEDVTPPKKEATFDIDALPDDLKDALLTHLDSQKKNITAH